MRESIFEAADAMTEKAAKERVETFNPETKLSHALHQIDPENIDVEEILCYDNNII